MACAELALSNIRDERALEALCAEILAKPRSRLRRDIAAALATGTDPLGDLFSELRSPARRRSQGATYTPWSVVTAMVDWATRESSPSHIVDPGTGSARFLVAAAAAFPKARLIGVELDPLAALIARTNLSCAGLSRRSRVIVGDYRYVELPRRCGETLFIGNPPYVRHHDIQARDKRWLDRVARSAGLPVSGLAGLHLHFFLATLCHARAGDRGSLITAGEWLDVNYGKLGRALFAGPLGLRRLDVIAPTAQLFADAQTTSVITSFEVGNLHKPARARLLAKASSLAAGLRGGRPISRKRLVTSQRWNDLLRRPRSRRANMIELGELCRVHRGQVTGANRVWIVGDETPPVPARFMQPAITRAKELFGAGANLRDDDQLRRIVDLPQDLDELSPRERELIDRFLAWARGREADRGYVARHRSPWWSVKLRQPAPILATYMARRPPAFVRNLAGARHINIAHGLYPRQPMSARRLTALAKYLNGSVSTDEGRTYAGGLTKFEPKEMERLLVPRPEDLP